MKKVILLGTLLLLAFTSCSKSDDKEEIIEQQEVARYYVKYEVTYNTQHINPKRTIIFTTESGKKTINLETKANIVSWEGTYGPVDKNFIAALDCSTPGYEYRSTIHARIYVCREKEPFVIKAEDEKESYLSLQYKIDF
jgi:hypothetical protein